MRLGAFDIHPLSDGTFRLDGGAMFGVVPKVLWERCCPADEANRIGLSVTCLLIRAHGKNILIDTGLGNKEDDKFHRMFAVERRPTLLESLARLGLQREDIHLVVNTHLHFDHAGGNTMLEDGELHATFPKAEYVVQRGEFDDAVGSNERTRASYRLENVLPIADRRRWQWLDGNTDLVPGVTAVVTAGHTRHHQGVLIESEGQRALFLGDVIPTVAHLPLPYIMGYDVDPLQTLETKRRLLTQASEDHWLLLFQHDPVIRAGVLQRDAEETYVLEPVERWQ